VVNWDYVGGSRRAYIIRPASPRSIYINIFLLMLLLAVLALACAAASAFPARLWLRDHSRREL
jgi:branched-chain amino acid transport system permease protein